MYTRRNESSIIILSQDKPIKQQYIDRWKPIVVDSVVFQWDGIRTNRTYSNGVHDPPTANNNVKVGIRYFPCVSRVEEINEQTPRAKPCSTAFAIEYCRLPCDNGH